MNSKLSPELLTRLNTYIGKKKIQKTKYKEFKTTIDNLNTSLYNIMSTLDIVSTLEPHPHLKKSEEDKEVEWIEDRPSLLPPSTTDEANSMYGDDYRIDLFRPHVNELNERFGQVFLSSYEVTNRMKSKRISIMAINKTLEIIHIAFPKLTLANFGITKPLTEDRSTGTLAGVLKKMNEFLEPVIIRFFVKTLYKTTYNKPRGMSNVPTGAGLSSVKKTTTEEEIHKYEVLKGEILAGNNNPKMLRDLKKQIKKLVTMKLLDPIDARDVLEEI